MKKSLIALLTATIITISMMAPVITMRIANATWTSINPDPTSWYATSTGLLNNDNYALYPYSTSSNLSIGISKFGEMIDPFAMTGLRYGNGSASNSIDPFASAPFVDEFEWNEGWVINMTYSYAGYYRNLWAFALYSDSWNASSIGKDWQRANAADSVTVLGGRKVGGYSADGSSMGYAYTAPLVTLYNGPRSYIALSNTTIGENAKQPIVRVYLTFVFDKVNKCVTVIKDIKLVDTRKGTGTIQVEFDNRGEWDLGKTTAPPSYAHIFTGLSTEYQSGYQPYYPDSKAKYDVAQIISTAPVGYVGFEAFWPQPVAKFVESFDLTTRTQRLTTMSTWKAVFNVTAQTSAFVLRSPNPAPIPYARGDGVWTNDPMVFVDGKIRPEGRSSANGWTWDSATKTVTFNTPLSKGDYVYVVYKYSVVQTDMSVSTGVPWVSGEWDFDLYSQADNSTSQFRAVSVLGIVDNHDASNSKLDDEVRYQLAQVFNPLDLQNAVEKQTSRWVEYSNNPIGNGGVFTTNPDNVPVTVVSKANWDQYNQTSERVEDLTAGVVLNRYLGQYGFHSNPDGTATFTGLNPAHYYKFLYSTYSFYEQDATSVLTNYYGQIESGTSTQTHSFTASLVNGSWTDPTGVSHAISTDGLDFSFTNASNTRMTTSGWFNYSATQWGEWETEPFTVYKENSTNLETMTPYEAPYEITNGSEEKYSALNFSVDSTEFNWVITPPGLSRPNAAFTYYTDVNFVYFCADPNIYIDVFYNAATKNYTVYASVTFGVPGNAEENPLPGYPNALYAYNIPGRYEVGVVGKNAATVDSAGLSMITAAFKDKEVEFGIAAEDMWDSTDVYNQIPFVNSRLGSGTSSNPWSNYYYSSMEGYPSTDQRVGLRDDWCTTWPVSSASIISSGGPLANMVSYYANDFASAFYGIPWFTSYAPWKNAIVPLSCWSALTKGGSGPYVDTNSTGFAVISVSEDLNGTVIFQVWGNWGRDTYYASQWFWLDGIREFQSFPHGVTSIVLEIDYKGTSGLYKPTHYAVDEMLGTISETHTIDTNAYMTTHYKGGIHFDP